jgi:hypothetical protein
LPCVPNQIGRIGANSFVRIGASCRPWKKARPWPPSPYFTRCGSFGFGIAQIVATRVLIVAVRVLIIAIRVLIIAVTVLIIPVSVRPSPCFARCGVFVCWGWGRPASARRTRTATSRGCCGTGSRPISVLIIAVTVLIIAVRVLILAVTVLIIAVRVLILAVRVRIIAVTVLIIALWQDAYRDLPRLLRHRLETGEAAMNVQARRGVAGMQCAVAWPGAMPTVAQCHAHSGGHAMRRRCPAARNALQRGARVANGRR